jgi:hypothetical protein
MTSAAFAAAFLSFSGALLLKLPNNMSASFFAGMTVRRSTDIYSSGRSSMQHQR